MKNAKGLQLPLIVPVLVLALLLNPFAYATPQENASASNVNPDSRDAQSDQSSAPANANVSGTLEDAAGVPANTPAVSHPTPPPASQLPDSPGSVQTSSSQSKSAPTGAVQSAQLAPPPQPSQALPQSQSREPLGTAAAETVPTMGIAASQPAGAALAPAKQRRVRTILITVGAILGAGAAAGVTMALSEGSPSKPPGAR